MLRGVVIKIFKNSPRTRRAPTSAAKPHWRNQKVARKARGARLQKAQARTRRPLPQGERRILR